MQPSEETILITLYNAERHGLSVSVREGRGGSIISALEGSGYLELRSASENCDEVSYFLVLTDRGREEGQRLHRGG